MPADAPAEPALQINPAELTARDLSYLVTGLIVPRPIAWVSTLDEAGAPNLAPHSYFNAVSTAMGDGIVSLTVALLPTAIVGASVGNLALYALNLAQA